MLLLDVNFTAKKALKATQKQKKNLIEEEWWSIKNHIRKRVHEGATTACRATMYEENIKRLEKLGYKIKTTYGKFDISWGEE